MGPADFSILHAGRRRPGSASPSMVSPKQARGNTPLSQHTWNPKRLVLVYDIYKIFLGIAYEGALHSQDGTILPSKLVVMGEGE
jgi:hypothetical protein